MTRNVSKHSSEKPLLGAVICCTSITPEERSVLAEYAQQMGAEHKLDLTADVTHLLVGSTDTPKYQYVAREREDVKVLRPEWVHAVRQRWMEDRVLDLHALDAEYQVPAFACLKICITGFDDLNFRAEIASTVRKHGGEYTGDLTKDVTHLIAAEPIGKKFEYATIWQKKIVSMKWYKESIERGMQLDESLYHPSLPSEEQGATAWNRQRRRDLSNGKRMQDSPPALEPVRKLRRTASSKLSSQTDSMWGEIVGAGGGGDNSQHGQGINEPRDVLRPSKSMPAMRQTDNKELLNKANPTRNSHAAFQTSRTDECFTGLCFCIEGFDSKQRTIVHNAISGMGAKIYDSSTDLLDSDRVELGNAFLMVPHQSRSPDLPSFGQSTIQPAVVTELWLEKCIIEKAFIEPQHYPLGSLIEEIRGSDIAAFAVNATGFSSIETLHISKAVAKVGARYEQMFTPQCSVLICKSGVVNQSKIYHARQWNVPALTEQWLWEFLRKGAIPPLDRHLVHVEQDSDNDIHKQFRQNRKNAPKQAGLKGVQGVGTDAPHKNNGSHSIHQDSVSTGLASTRDKSKALEQASRADVHTDDNSNGKKQQEVPLRPSPENLIAKEHSFEGPHHQSLDGTSEMKAETAAELAGATAKASIRHTPTTGEESVNSAIQELLNVKARAKSVQQNADQTSKGRPKKKILGRALSNVSNSSRTSNPRMSRASSIDSLNTDGVGSELAPPSANSRAEDDSTGYRGPGVSLLGRAPSRNKALSQNQVSQPIDISDPNLCRDEFNEAESTPQLTQLGYEDSEEAVALRARLAEKRRTRAQLERPAGETQPSAMNKAKDVPKRRVVKDDETVLALEGQSGWGGGRRTRRKEKDFADEMF